MSSLTKFSFDRQFDSDQPMAATPEPAPSAQPLAATAPESEESFIAADVDAAFARGLAEGREAGMREAEQKWDQETAAVLESIGAQLGRLASECGGHTGRIRRESLEIVAAVTRKMLDPVMAVSAEESLVATITDILPRIADEPRIVIRVANDRLDAIQQRMEAIAVQCGFGGNVILLSDPALGGADCHVEWADGGAEADTESLWREIDEAIDRHISKPDERSDPINTDDENQYSDQP